MKFELLVRHAMTNSLEKVVKQTVRQHLDGATIDTITVQPDEDSDGDPVLRITVVISSDMGAIDPRRLTSMGRIMRPKLEDLGEPGFPIFRFISKRDYKRLKHEAA
ncbi:MAG: hypothetical protein KGQ37_10630 [Hyphomicrobiales bacterium]|nr:hypothetical protein [Hyphomicrobiales bacterium]